MYIFIIYYNNIFLLNNYQDVTLLEGGGSTGNVLSTSIEEHFIHINYNLEKHNPDFDICAKSHWQVPQ